MKKVSENNIHKRSRAATFQMKAALLRVKRGIENALGEKIRRAEFSGRLANERIIAESKTPLWTEAAPEEHFLLVGKVQNLRIAARRLNGLEIRAGQTFSFWKNVGRASRMKGFEVGRELREGCIIPNVGGGLCQISNALYDAALKAGFEIVERHAHSQIVAGSLAEQGRDATVFWNYIDLRFRSDRDFRIETKLGKDHLSVTFKSSANIELPKSKPGRVLFSTANGKQPNSCAACGVESCFRSIKKPEIETVVKTAFLVDEFSPEFDKLITETRRSSDILLFPLDGKRFGKPNYAWNTGGFTRRKQAFFSTIKRSYSSRKLSAQGASRQNNLLEMSQKLAEFYAKHVPSDVLHLVVSQNLLPFLWENGALGGRTFDVLMNSMPMRRIQKTLDLAFDLHPESKTLGDFRADARLVEAESQALENASRIFTAHTGIAADFPGKATVLPWKIPCAANLSKVRSDKFTIVFPSSTVGRKGCYELREAIRGLDVELIVLGAEIEELDFWKGFAKRSNCENWLEQADLVVLPAFVEHKPRRLLLASANRIPVIATKNCGLEGVEGVTIIDIGDKNSLRLAIESNLKMRI